MGRGNHQEDSDAGGGLPGVAEGAGRLWRGYGEGMGYGGVRADYRSVLFPPYLKTVNFTNGVPGVSDYGVLNHGHGCRRTIWPLLRSVPGKRCKNAAESK